MSFVLVTGGTDSLGRQVVIRLLGKHHLRVHLALGIWLRISSVEFAMVFVAIILVVVSEMINTVVEACVDLTTREYHPLARVAKDVAAGGRCCSARCWRCGCWRLNDAELPWNVIACRLPIRAPHTFKMIP